VATLCDLTSQKQREDVLRDRVAALEQELHSRAGTDHIDGRGKMAAPRATPRTSEVIRGVVVLGTSAAFVATVACLAGWGVVSALAHRGENRERSDDWEFGP
jgi:hypothetical protein